MHSRQEFTLLLSYTFALLLSIPKPTSGKIKYNLMNCSNLFLMPNTSLPIHIKTIQSEIPGVWQVIGFEPIILRNALSLSIHVHNFRKNPRVSNDAQLSDIPEFAMGHQPKVSAIIEGASSNRIIRAITRRKTSFFTAGLFPTLVDNC